MKKFLFIVLCVLLFVVLTGSREVIYDRQSVKHWTLKIVFYDTSLTLATDTLESETFTISDYPYSSVQIAITTDNDSLVLWYKCSQFDSATYWAIAEMESVGVVGTLADDRMRIFGNADLQIPVTKYIRYYFDPLTAGVEFKIFFDFWRGQ